MQRTQGLPSMDVKNMMNAKKLSVVVKCMQNPNLSCKLIGLSGDVTKMILYQKYVNDVGADLFTKQLNFEQAKGQKHFEKYLNCLEIW